MPAPKKRKISKRASIVGFSSFIHHKMEETFMNFLNIFHSLASLERTEDERRQFKMA
jgi:hypothetical protein